MLSLYTIADLIIPDLFYKSIGIISSLTNCHFLPSIDFHMSWIPIIWSVRKLICYLLNKISFSFALILSLSLFIIKSFPTSFPSWSCCTTPLLCLWSYLTLSYPPMIYISPCYTKLTCMARWLNSARCVTKYHSVPLLHAHTSLFYFNPRS